MKNKANKIMVITVTDVRNIPKQQWTKPLTENCKELVWIDLKKIYLEHGKEKTQKILLKKVEQEKPEFLFMYDSLFYDINLLSLMDGIKQVSKKTRTVLFSGDDDLTFDYTRYLALFFDYILLGLIDYVKIYEEHGLNNAYYITPADYKEIPQQAKKYDVTFMGADKADRREVLDYLHKSGVNITLFGYPTWKKYPGLRDIYKGMLPSEEYLKTISQSKINLCFSKNMLGVPHLTGRFLENSVLKSFSLIEYSPQVAELLKEGKEIVMFKTKEEALKKIKYYLEHENERENIAKAAYKKVTVDFDFRKNLKKFIQKALKQKPKSNVPKEDSSLIYLNEKLMKEPKEQLFKKIKNFEYIAFSKGKVIKSRFKDRLQVYSIKENKKQISCCDYTIYSKQLGDYARFRFVPFGKVPNREYAPYLSINQIVMTKKFFIENFAQIKNAYKKEMINFVNQKNTAFVSIPLVRISKFRSKFFKQKELTEQLGLFLFSFHRELYARRKNPIRFMQYVFSLLKEIIMGKRFIIKQIKYRIPKS
ncbi:glycosyltransferase [Candidatus Pacearchaeota archaeon]|nr:glycosyltransferase [Candidatus Pacearchaeota archaeon]